VWYDDGAMKNKLTPPQDEEKDEEEKGEMVE
jgi:hypothetical protein